MEAPLKSLYLGGGWFNKDVSPPCRPPAHSGRRAGGDRAGLPPAVGGMLLEEEEEQEQEEGIGKRDVVFTS